MNTATDTDSVGSNSVPKGWVTLAAVVLIVAALAGTYLGVERSLGAHDLPSDADPLASSVPNVTNAKPLADTAADDARMRALIHEEVAAALKSARPAAPKPTPKADDDGDSSSNDATAALNAAAGKPVSAAKPATRPAPTAVSPSSPAAATPN